MTFRTFPCFLTSLLTSVKLSNIILLTILLHRKVVFTSLCLSNRPQDTTSAKYVRKVYAVSRCEYPHGKLVFDTTLKKELEKKASTATRNDFCTTFGEALMLMRKDKPDITLL